MSKSNIYTELFSTKTIIVEECPLSGNKPYHLCFNKTLSSPSLFDNISLLIEHSIKFKHLEFDKICATSMSALPYATNVATSFEKGILYINNQNHSGNDNGNDNLNIKNIKIEGGMEIDDKIILIETVVSNEYLLNNIINKIRKYGGNIIGVILIMNLCEGEYITLSHQKENIIPILNIYDVFNHLENNNLIEMYYCEKIKFYCENMTKVNIKKLLPKSKEEQVEIKQVEIKQVENCEGEGDCKKEPFVGQ